MTDYLEVPVGANIPVATEAQAEAGTDDTVTMTPLKTAQAIAALAAGGASLPVVSGADNGDVLTVVSGVWAKAVPGSSLPAVTGADNGDVLTVVSGAWAKAASAGGSTVFNNIQDGRLTLTSGVPITTSDVTAATTVYFTPSKGNSIALYSGSAWAILNFTELSFSVPATTNTVYDVFAYNNSGVVALETLAWTNTTTRATALVKQDGVYVKSGVTTRRYLGSFCTTATSGQTEDSQTKRLVWNYNNRIARYLQRFESTASWTYSTNTLRQANANTANQLGVVVGLSEEPVIVNLNTDFSNSTTTPRFGITGIGIDSITTATLPTASNGATTIAAVLVTTNPIVLTSGYHYLAWLEQGAGTDIQTWYGGGGRGIYGYING